jgi:hypothetical protein
MTEKRQPRGIRNNNPGNIERNSTEWQGMSQDQSADARFCVFDEPVYGLRALMKVLLTYYRKYNLNTAESIINRWAPPHENDTNAYAKAVAKRLGVRSITTPISVDNKDTLVKLAIAIVMHENGSPKRFNFDIPPQKFWYSLNMYRDAAKMALK